MGSRSMDRSFETKSVRMEQRLLLTVQAPVDDVDRIMEKVVKFAPLAMGKYDNNAFQSGAGVERYRFIKITDGLFQGIFFPVRYAPV